MVDAIEINRAEINIFLINEQQSPLGGQTGIASKLFVPLPEMQTSQLDENRAKKYLEASSQDTQGTPLPFLVKVLSKISKSTREILGQFTDCIALSKTCLADAKEVNRGLCLQQEATLLQTPLKTLEEHLQGLRAKNEEIRKKVKLLNPLLNFLVCHCMALIGSFSIEETSQAEAFLKREVSLLDTQQKAVQMEKEELAERNSIEYRAVSELDMKRRVLTADLHVAKWLQNYEELIQREQLPSDEEIKQLGLQAGRALEGDHGLLPSFQAELLNGVLERIDATGSASVKSAAQAFKKLDQKNQTANVFIELLLFKFNERNWLKEYSDANALLLEAEQLENPLNMTSLLNEKIARLEVLAHYRIVNLSLPFDEEIFADICVEPFVVDLFRSLEPHQRTASVFTSLLLSKLKQRVWELSNKEVHLQAAVLAPVGAALAQVARSVFSFGTFPKGFFN